MYESGPQDGLRYVLSSDKFRIELNQSGRDVWLVMGDGAFHLTPQDLTDTEYGRLRYALGPLGMPLLAADQIVPWVERHYQVIEKKQEKSSGDVRMAAVPHPALADLLSSMVAYQSGAAGRLLAGMIPVELHLRISQNGGHVDVQQMNSGGTRISRLTLDFSNSPGPLDSPFLPPREGPVLSSRELMMALGAGPSWLVGKSAPDGILQKPGGATQSMSEFFGRPMLINFWATWCGPCRVEWPVLQDLYDKHGKDAAFLLLTHESASTVRDYIDANGFTAPVYLLPDQKILQGFGVDVFPMTYLVDSRGIIRHAFRGFAVKGTIEETRASLRNKYDAVLSEMIGNGG